MRRHRGLRWPGGEARAGRRAVAQVPPWVDALARGLRAGKSLVAALADASAATPAPLGPEVQALVRRIDAGAGVRSAVSDVRTRTANPALGRALAAVALAHEAGGAHAPAFEALAGALRAHAASERERRALATPVRTSALVIGLAPLGVLGLVGAASPGTLRDAWTTPVGAGALVVGLVAEALGLWWIHALSTARARPARRLPWRRTWVAPAHEVAEVADLCRVALASGFTVLRAVALVAAHVPTETAAAFGRAVAVDARDDAAGSPVDALAGLADALGDAARELCAALVAAARDGTPVVPALERVAFELRLQRRIEAEASARRTSVLLLFPLVGCVLPAFVLLAVVPLVLGALAALPGATP